MFQQTPLSMNLFRLAFMNLKLYRRQGSLLKKRREKSNIVLAAIVIMFIVCQSLRLTFKINEINLMDDHVSLEVFYFCHQ